MVRSRTSGLEVVLETSGDPAAVSAPAALASYRVIQESLTNTVKHAEARRATVRLHITADSVDVSVTDDGVGPAPGAVPGHGINGMRERVTALGGTFRAGAAEGGGYAVHATIPVAGFRP